MMSSISHEYSAIVSQMLAARMSSHTPRLPISLLVFKTMFLRVNKPAGLAARTLTVIQNCKHRKHTTDLARRET